MTSAEVPHAPTVCAACGAALGPDLKRRCVSAHNSLELARGDMSLQVTATKHVYFAVRCPCGHDNVDRPGVGLRSEIEGRRRNLQMSERCLVGPMLATFIAALSLRFRLSRRKIQEFLHDWLGLELGAATIERCVHEFGLASEPVVEQLIQDVRAAEIVHVDETPWYQKGDLRWMWVAMTATTTVFRIGSRRKEELTDADRRGVPGLAGHRRLSRLPRSSPPPALPGASDPQGPGARRGLLRRRLRLRPRPGARPAPPDRAGPRRRGRATRPPSSG